MSENCFLESATSIINPEESELPHSKTVPHSDQIRCKICFQTHRPLVSCCECSGSIAHVHETCILDWMGYMMQKEGVTRIPNCQICKAVFSAKINTNKRVCSTSRFYDMISKNKLLAVHIAVLAIVIILSVAQLGYAFKLLLVKKQMRFHQFLTLVFLPLYLIYRSTNALEKQRVLWRQCMVQMVEIQLQPYEILQ